MQFIRYLLVQLVAYIIDMGGFILLSNHYEINPLVVNIITKILAGLFAFVAHYSFTFEILHSSNKKKKIVQYFTLLSLNIPFSTLVLSIILWFIPMQATAKLVADIICVFISYSLSKKFVFSSNDNSKGANIKVWGKE